MRLSANRLLSLFLAALLLAGQWAGQLHALSHARHDLALALAAPGPAGEAIPQGPANPPRLDHSADHCIAFHALDGAAVAAAGLTPGRNNTQFFHALPGCTLRAADPLPFSSRAPPVPV